MSPTDRHAAASSSAFSLSQGASVLPARPLRCVRSCRTGCSKTIRQRRRNGLLGSTGLLADASFLDEKFSPSRHDVVGARTGRSRSTGNGIATSHFIYTPSNEGGHAYRRRRCMLKSAQPRVYSVDQGLVAFEVRPISRTHAESDLLQLISPHSATKPGHRGHRASFRSTPGIASPQKSIRGPLWRSVGAPVGPAPKSCLQAALAPRSSRRMLQHISEA